MPQRVLSEFERTSFVTSNLVPKYFTANLPAVLIPGEKNSELLKQKTV